MKNTLLGIITNLYLTVYLFLFIYNPPISKQMIIHLLAFFSAIIIISVKKYREKSIDILLKSKLWVIVLVMFIAMAYLLTLGIFLKSINLKGIYVYFILGVEISVCTLHTLLIISSSNYKGFSLLNLLFIVASLESVISIATFLLPSLHTAVVSYMVNNGISEVYLKLHSRVYGLSRSLTSTMPIAQTMLGAISFYLGLNKQAAYFVLTPLLLFSGAINARVSIVVFLLGIVIALFYTDWNNNYVKIKTVAITGVLLISTVLFLSFIQKNSANLYAWFTYSVKDIRLLLQGYKFGTFKYLFSETFLSIPAEAFLLYGTGYDIFGKIRGSDVGYINDLWRGGILLCIILYYSFFKFCVSIVYYKMNINRFIGVFCLITMIVYNIKGIAIVNSELTTLVILLVCAGNLKNHKENCVHPKMVCLEDH